MNKKALLGLLALIVAALIPYGVVVSVNDPNPDQPVPPTPPASSTPTAAPPTDTQSPAPPGDCVAPAGMKGLLSQDPKDSQRPWKRNGAPKVTVWFAAQNLSAEWYQNLQLGQAAWNKSPCLDVRLLSGPCPTGQNCVTVHAFNKLPDGDDGNFDDKLDKSGRFTVGGDIQLLNTLSPGEKRNVAAHEMGHALSLRHVTVKRDLMDPDTYDNVWNPSELDYQNLLYSYDMNSPLQK